MQTRHELKARNCLISNNYHDLFTEGACWVFALRLHERFNWQMRAFSRIYGATTSENLHIWCRLPSSEFGIDVNGVREEEELVRLVSNGGGYIFPFHDLEPSKAAEFLEMNFSDKVLLKQVLHAADLVYEECRDQAGDRFVAARSYEM